MSIWTLLLHGLLTLAFECPTGDLVSRDFVEFKATRDAKIQKFANSKASAEMADKMLANLITAKSPIILIWLRNHKLEDKSEDEIAKAWRVYFAENFLLRSPESQSPEMVNLIEDLYKTVATEKRRKHFENLFEKSKKLALKTISNPKVRARVEGIKLFWLKDFKGSRFEKNPADLLYWGVAYEPPHNEINMGMEFLRYGNDSNIMAVFLHEMAHSFDPCRWGAFFEGPNPYAKVIECLRNPKSVGAKPRDDSKMAEMVSAKKLSVEIQKGLQLSPFCNKMEYPPTGVQADQINEAFADWFSAEALALEKDLESGFRQDLCEKNILSSGSSYPTNQDRLNKIYFSQPTLKKKFKFDGGGMYCSP